MKIKDVIAKSDFKRFEIEIGKLNLFIKKGIFRSLT
jgi:hypothetical protein